MLESIASARGATPAELLDAQAGNLGGRAVKSAQSSSRAATGRSVVLPDDVYERIEAAALASGVSVADWIATRATASTCAASPPVPEHGEERVEGEDDQPETRTMADRLAGRIGTVRSGRSDLSERGRELFLEGLLEKKRMGRL
jgi:hypothetical protein